MTLVVNVSCVPENVTVIDIGKDGFDTLRGNFEWFGTSVQYNSKSAYL